jgi:hypothetical protein
MRTLVVMLLLISTPSFAQRSNPLIGNWKLVSQQAIVDALLHSTRLVRTRTAT